jgi:DNA-3-methyladenine glycosylase II
VTLTEKFYVTAIPPFNFDLSAQIFTNGNGQIRTYEKGKFRQAIRIDGKVALCFVESVGTIEKPNLLVELKTNTKLTAKQKENAAEIVSALFNLNFDLTAFYEEIRKDETMRRLARKLFGLKSPTTQFAFEALVDSIVEQQISLKVANVLERKLIKKWGDALSLDGGVFYAYPSPKSLAAATTQELRNVGLSQRKAEYIKDAASLIAEEKLDLETLKTCPNPDDIIKELDKIRGVGVWTAELTMIRGMQRLEALPADDLGLRRTIAHFYCNDKMIPSSQAREIAKNWGTWKGLAAYYLIVAEILGIEP